MLMTPIHNVQFVPCSTRGTLKNQREGRRSWLSEVCSTALSRNLGPRQRPVLPDKEPLQTGLGESQEAVAGISDFIHKMQAHWNLTFIVLELHLLASEDF